MRKTLLILTLLAACSLRLSAQFNVEIYGNVPGFNTSGLFVTEAGNDFNSVIEESHPSTYISISNPMGGNRDYVVYGQAWVSNSSTVLKVKRISDGTNQSGGGAIGRISDGLDYVQLSETPVPFFTGRGNRKDVLLKFSLSSLSVVNPTGYITFYVSFYAYPIN